MSVRTFSLFSAVIIACVSLFSGGCARDETPRKVSLYSRAAGEMKERQEKGFLFGFEPLFDPKEDVRVYTPFLAYLEKATGRRFSARLSGMYEETVEKLGSGDIHFAVINPLSYIRGREKYGSKIRYLASGLDHEGDPNGRSVVFVSRESDIKDVKELKGRSFAFGPAMSSYGYLVPRKMLEDAGIGLGDLRRHVNTGSPMETVRSVLKGENDAGGVRDVIVYDLLSEGMVRILAVSEPYHGSIIAYNTDLDGEVVDAVRTAVLAFEPAGKQKGMLSDWEKTEMAGGFIRVSGPEFYKVAVLARKYGLLTK